MTKIFLTIAAIAVASATPGMAQELSGATFTGTYHGFDDDNLFGIEAAGEFTINPSFAIGGGVGLYNSDEAIDGEVNLTARGMYLLSPTSAIGLFYARDTIDDGETNAFGLEYGFGSSNGRFEAYYANLELSSDPDGVDRGYGGLSFEFAVANNFFVMVDSQAEAAVNGISTATTGTASIGARYQFDQGPSIFAEIGRVASEVEVGSVVTSEDEEDFIGIGAEFTIGRSSGTLLSNRSVYQTSGF